MFVFSLVLTICPSITYYYFHVYASYIFVLTGTDSDRATA